MVISKKSPKFHSVLLGIALGNSYSFKDTKRDSFVNESLYTFILSNTYSDT